MNERRLPRRDKTRSRSRSRSASRHRRHRPPHHHHRHDKKHRSCLEVERKKAEGTEKQKLANRAQVANRSRMWSVVGSDSSESSGLEAGNDKEKKGKKRRKTSLGRRDRRRRRSRSSSASSADESKSSRSSDSLEDERLKRKRQSRSSKEDKKRRRKTTKKGKRGKKTDGSRKLAVDQDEYGKYGILRESDFHCKSVSFHAWLRDVKKMGEFNGPKWEAMELFKEYMEDYNTCTMPHEKYYDIETYEMRRYQKQQRKAFDKQKGASSDKAIDALADEERVRRERLDARGKKEQEEFRLVLQLMDKDKIEAMREQERLRAQMQLMYKSGNVQEARRLEQILNKVEEDPRFKR